MVSFANCGGFKVISRFPDIRDMDPKLLHIGCGQLVGKHWVNVDSSPNVFLDNHAILKALLWPILPHSSKQKKFTGVKWIDLRAPWKFPDNHFDAVFSSHFFEHLAFADGQHVLKECFRVLKPGGSIRFIVPSITEEIQVYHQLKKKGEPLAATRFAEVVNVFHEPEQGSWWYRLYFKMYDKNSHKMFYDADSLAHYLHGAGFEGAVPAGYLKSTIPFLDEVELADRHERAFCVEARKPLAQSLRKAS